MAIDFQPVDFEPADTKVDFQPVDFEPVEAPKKKASVASTGASIIPGQEAYTAKPKYVNPDDTGTKGLGILEALGTAASGVLSMGTGLVGGGLASLNELGQGKIPNFRENVESVANATTYEPRTETGKNIVQNVVEPIGTNLQAFGPAGYGIPHTGALRSAQIAADQLKGKLRGERVAAEAPKSAVDSIIAAELKKQKVDFEPAGTQGDLFGFPEEGQASPYNAGTVGTTEPITPARQARQQELPLRNDLPGQMQATPEGVLAGAEQMPEIMQRRNIDTDRLIAEAEAGRPAPRENVQGPEPLENRAPIQVTPEGVAIPPGALDEGALLGQQRQAAVEQAAATARDRAMQASQEAAYRRATGQPEPAFHPEVTADIHGQGDLFGVGNPTPFTREGQWHVDENGMPIRSDLSMEAQNVQNPLQRNFWGDELGPSAGQDRSLSAAIDSMPAGTARQAALSRFKQQGHIYFGEGERKNPPRIVPTGRGFIAMRDGREVGRLESNMTPEQNKQLQGMGEKIPATIDIVKVDPSVKGTGTGAALYKAFYDAHEGNVMPSGKTTQDAWNVWRRNYPEKVTEFINSEAQRIQDGAPLNQVLANITDEGVRTQVRNIATGKDTATQVAAWNPGQSFNAQRRGQGGGLYMGKQRELDTLKGIPGMRGKLGHMEHIPISAEEVMAHSEKFGDVSGSLAQRLLVSLSKGSLYNAPRINNPRYTFATQALRNADGYANAAIRDIIHDTYAPALRDLSKEDYTKTAHLLMAADKAGVRPTAESMRGHGFSEQAIAVVEGHYEFADKLYDSALKPAADAAGIQNVDQRTAYAADRLTGDFRAPVMKDGKQVGWLTADTKPGLELKKRAYKKIDGGAEFADTQYKGGKGGSDMGISQLYKWLADQDPSIAKFGEVIQEMNQKMATDYLGAKRHTMNKEGDMFGFAGKDPTKDAYGNAKDFWNSQVKYGENVIKWAEMSKALEEVKKVMNDPATPVLNRYIKEYVDNALGRNPNKIGRTFDSLTDAIGEAGAGTTVPREIAGGLKKLTNGKLLTFSTGYYAQNAVQGLTRTPEFQAYLRAHGLDASVLGMDSFGKGGMEAMGAIELSPTAQAAVKWAEANHVYSSELFETSSQTRKNVSHWADKTSLPASTMEGLTRKSFFLSSVDALEKAGYTKETGLFETARNLTDKFMNNYSPMEKPLAYNTVGGAISRGAYNLMSYKANEISRMVEHIGNLKDKKMIQPLLVNLATQVALAGVMGTMGYKEAELAYDLITSAMGEPKSLTETLMKNKDIPDLVKYGVPSVATNADFTQRMGTGALTPQGVADLMPGATAITKPIGAAYDVAKNNTEANRNKLYRELAPVGPIQGAVDRQLMSKDVGGKELAINPRTQKGTVVRDESDKMAKNLGFTGMHESREKTLEYERDKIEKFYGDKRVDALKDLSGALLTQNEGDRKDAIRKYIKFRGDPSSLGRDIQKMAVDQGTDAQTQALLAAQASNITNAYKLRDRMR